jgi:hypothetical protein
VLVFGDRSEQADPRERLHVVVESVRKLAGMAPGLGRHAALAGALIEAGRLLQGLADADFVEAKQDRAAAVSGAFSTWLLGLARMLRCSWDSGFADIGDVPCAPEIGDLPVSVQLKTPEGFAFYALYPEAYLEAARRLRLVAAPRVIGIRSIGTTLGAVVAAALDTEPPVTLRPFGHPFARQVAMDAALERRLLDGEPHYVIVDEGPGQSGSSFGAVADWLQARGVPPERIAFVPSHDGAMGPQASSRHRQLWGTAQREVADFGDRLQEMVGAWAGGLFGSIDGAPEDMSGGEWRRRRFGSESEWPPSIPMFERRKFLLRHAGKLFLAKFAGLGSIGEEKLRLARALHAAGFVPLPVGLVHGFLVERWHGDSTPLRDDDRPVEVIARFLGARARLFPAGETEGASIAELFEMSRRNISLALGDEAAGALGRWQPRLEQLQSRIRRVRTDNRLDRHDWLRTADGRLLKTDAVDHHQAHDLIGCQDIAWDVAGAIAEFDLDDGDAERLIAATAAASGVPVDRELLDFCQIAYSAFRLGLASLGVEITADQPAEQRRLEFAQASYRGRLERRLQRSSSATRRQSLVG